MARLLWGVSVALAALTFVVYLASGDRLMPLDDAYIHFQYTRQLADNQPYVYNPGDDPTSGATSFIYPYALAAGYLIGFRDLDLGVWAMGIGALALLASTVLVMRLGRELGAPPGLALFGGLTFVLSGPVAWHFMSGMETGLMIAFTLWTLHASITGRGLIPAATLLALTRPEGSIMAVIAVGLFYLTDAKNRDSKSQRRDGILAVRKYLLPLIAAGVQPALNLLLTGSASAAGSQAKSILSRVPFSWETVTERIWDNFSRMGAEFLAASNWGMAGDFMPFWVPLFALAGVVWLLRDGDRRPIGVLIVLWLLSVAAAIATLDTAFWHFKRYQMPLIALFYPLSIWGMLAVWRWITFGVLDRNNVGASLSTPRFRLALATLAGIILLLFAAPTWLDFLRLYQINTQNVAVQPYTMARWLRENTPEDARIAVHDVGMMRYIGQRYTIDMVGLTTPGAADAWRNGPGAVAEFLEDQNPDYVAAYTTARGLNYLVETGLYGELLAVFPADFAPEDNVALAADYQGIFRVTGLPADEPEIIIDAVDVADLESERGHDYMWHNDSRLPGFVTEAYQMTYPDGRTAFDGGRRINGGETFTLQAGEAGWLVTRVHPGEQAIIDIYANNALVDTQWIPIMPGRWFDVITPIPAGDDVEIRIEPDGVYMPYHHWLIPSPQQQPGLENPVANYQDGAFRLAINWAQSSDELVLTVAVETNGSTTGDYKFFVHVYDDPNSPPVAQSDAYLNDSPAGNWPPGVLDDKIVVNLAEIPPGQYTLAVGFYEATTFDRLPPDGTADDDRRLFIGEIEVNDG